jgi:hypothetical protein
MTGTSVAREQESKRYPLSFTQEWFLTMDKGDDGGPFGGSGRGWRQFAGVAS